MDYRKHSALWCKCLVSDALVNLARDLMWLKSIDSCEMSVSIYNFYSRQIGKIEKSSIPSLSDNVSGQYIRRADYTSILIHTQRRHNMCLWKKPGYLKGLAQAKIIKKSVILFRVLNMTIWCKHVHRLKLNFFFNFCAAHSPVRLDIETKFPHFLFLTWLSIITNQEFRLYI